MPYPFHFLLALHPWLPSCVVLHTRSCFCEQDLFLEVLASWKCYTLFRAPRGVRAARATRGKGRTTSPIQKDPAAASYGCPTSAERDDVAEGGKKRCNTRFTFETCKYNSCDIRLKALKHLKLGCETLEKHLKTLANHCNNTQTSK
jgi:hypothetical protein